MDNDNLTQELSMEDRLKAIAYQFIALYERWSEDRQIAAKQGANTEECIKNLIAKINEFKLLKNGVSDEIGRSIRAAANDVKSTIGEEVRKSAMGAVKETGEKLKSSVDYTIETLNFYQKEFEKTHWMMVVVGMVTTIISALLIVKILMPDPILPLTDTQVQYLQSGEMLQKAWPKLSKQEKNRIESLAGASNSPQANASDDDQDNNNDNNDGY